MGDYSRSLTPEQYSVTEADTRLTGILKLPRIGDISDSMPAECYRRFLDNSLLDDPSWVWAFDFGLEAGYIGLLLDVRRTKIFPDDREFTFDTKDKPQQYAAKLHYSHRFLGWTTHRQSIFAVTADIDEG